MKFNINKAMLLKNRFWIILGGSICVTLTGLFWLQTSDYAEGFTKTNKQAYQVVKGAREPFENPLRIKSREELAAEAGKAESSIWIDAWKTQEPLYAWANSVEKEFKFRNGLFATAISVTDVPAPKETLDQEATLPYVMHGQLVDAENDWLKIKNRKGEETTFYRTRNVDNVLLASKQVSFKDLENYRGKSIVATYQKGRYFNELLTPAQRQTYAETHKSQIHEILEIVDPYDINGKGVVQLRNWLYRKTEFPDPSMKFIRFVNQPWNIAKDFSKEAWVAQENLWIQKEIYRTIRAANDQVSAFVRDEKQPHIFRNNALELHLSLAGNQSLTVFIKNRLPKKQKLDMSFRVSMNKGFNPELIPVSELPLAPKNEANDSKLVKAYDKKKDERTGIYNVEQVLSWESAAIKRIDHISIGSTAPDDMSHGHRTSPTPLIPFDPVPAPDPNDPRPKPPGGGPNPFEHGLWPNRYLEVSEQSRRVPVCIVLIVDQSHVDRILTAFNNSHLRFLSTQVLLNHYTGSIQPLALPEKEGGVIGKEPGIIRPPMGVPGVGGGGGGSGAEANMELVIYGVMTLYERFPPRPPTVSKQ